MKNIIHKINEFSPWLLAGIAALSAGLATNVLWNYFIILQTRKPLFFDPWGIIFVSTYFFLIWVIYKRRNAFFRPRTRFLKDIIKVNSQKNLILFLSHLNPIRAPHSYQKGIPSWLLPLSDPPDYQAEFAKMEDLKSAQRLIWNWQMPLKAVYHHRKTLERVVIICSNSELSVGAVHQFIAFCKRYKQLENIDFKVFRKESSRISDIPNFKLTSEDGLDFDSFEQVSSAVWHVLNYFKRMEAKESDIVIDFTGGMKVTSVVAAATTFNRKVKAQYVNTGNMRVNGYDVIFASNAPDESDLM